MSDVDTMSTDVARLARAELFAGLEIDELHQLASYTSPFTLAPGDVLFNRGDRTDSVFLIDAGCLEVAAKGPTGWTIVGHVGRGEVTGEMALLTGEPRSATLRAIEHSSGIAIGKDVIESLRRSHRRGGLVISRYLATIACRRIRRRLAEFGGESDLDPPVATGERGTPCRPDDTDHVSSLPWFAALNDELNSVLKLGRWTSVPRGTVLVQLGAEPAGILVPTRGALEELLDSGDYRYRVRLAGPGRAAANLGVLDESGSPTTVRALERAIIFELPRHVVAELWRGDGKASRALLASITQDLAGAVVAANNPHPWELRT